MKHARSPADVNAAKVELGGLRVLSERGAIIVDGNILDRANGIVEL